MLRSENLNSFNSGLLTPEQFVGLSREELVPGLMIGDIKDNDALKSVIGKIAMDFTLTQNSKRWSFDNGNLEIDGNWGKTDTDFFYPFSPGLFRGSLERQLSGLNFHKTAIDRARDNGFLGKISSSMITLIDPLDLSQTTTVGVTTRIDNVLSTGEFIRIRDTSSFLVETGVFSMGKNGKAIVRDTVTLYSFEIFSKGDGICRGAGLSFNLKKGGSISERFKKQHDSIMNPFGYREVRMV